MEKQIVVAHQIITANVTFEYFTERFERLAGHFDPSVLTRAHTDPAWVIAQIEQMQGQENLIIFNIFDHGMTLGLYGIHQKLKLYNIGNPLIAASMTRHNPVAGLYAPLHVIVYENNEKQVIVEYDLPSSFFGVLGNEKIAEVGLGLNEKILRLINSAQGDQ